MDIKQFNTLKYFKASEFKYPDKMNSFLLHCLDDFRNTAGIPVIITSDYRTPEENAAAGGAKNSAHLRGLAVDIAVSNSRERFIFLRAAIVSGQFMRIGIGRNFIHLDVDKEKAQEVAWLY